MFKNYYKIKISGKDIKWFIKLLYRKNISFLSLDIHDNYFTALIDKKSYDILCTIKTSYNINLEKIYGFQYLKLLIKENYIFLFSFIFSFIFFIILTNITFDIVILTDDNKLKDELYSSLINNGIKKYSFNKSYDEINVIKSNILSNLNDKIEWLEIERDGTKYYVRFEKRIINDIKKESPIRHVVASKNGIIKNIYAKNGEVIKKINDYVSRGDIIISGEIHKNDKVLDNISADGAVYAEVWYKVKVSLPINYYEKRSLNNYKKTLSINFLNNKLTFFKSNFINKEVNSSIILDDLFSMFNVSINKEEELLVNDSVNTIANENLAIKYASMKINSQLNSDEYIISQKKLKTTLNDSTIIVEVFFKVYENISSYKSYEIEKGM